MYSDKHFAVTKTSKMNKQLKIANEKINKEKNSPNSTCTHCQTKNAVITVVTCLDFRTGKRGTKSRAAYRG